MVSLLQSSGENASFLPAGNLVYMVLQVDEAEEEGHDAAERKRDIFLGVVIVLHGFSDFENSDDVRNHASDDHHKAHDREALVVRRCCKADGKNSSYEACGIHS